MKSPGWKIYIALFLLIILVVAFRYTEGFDSYNKTLNDAETEYNIDSSNNDTYKLKDSSELTQVPTFDSLTNIQDNSFRKPDITSGWDFFSFKK